MNGSAVYGGDLSGVTAVVLHGPGTSSAERLLPLVREFVAHGCRGIAFDFSGHGESTGKLSELSLRRRFEQAIAVIDAPSARRRAVFNNADLPAAAHCP